MKYLVYLIVHRFIKPPIVHTIFLFKRWSRSFIYFWEVLSFFAAVTVVASTLLIWGRHNNEAGLGQPDINLAVYQNAENVSEAIDPDLPTEPQKNVLTFTTYFVERGDTISGIAQKAGLNQDSIISCNDIERARLLQTGTPLRIPNMNGIMYTVAADTTLEKLSKNYNIPQEQILEVNNVEEFAYKVGAKIFIPEAKLPTIELRRVWGELFRYPLRGWITSPYGYRADPFTGERSFHTGIDIAGTYGAPVRAAMEGRVIDTGYNDISGNYVVITHAGGYTTSYAHMSFIHVRTGEWVKEGQRVGDVGSTGYSTGSHLHFTISRWQKTINPVLLLH